MSAYYWPITGAQGPEGPQGPAGPAGGGGMIVGSLPNLAISNVSDFYTPVVWNSRQNNTLPPSFATGQNAANWTPIPGGGTLTNFYLLIGTAQGVDGDLTATIMLNGFDTLLVLTIPAGSPAGQYSNLVDTASFFAGDKITLHLTNASASTTNVENWCISII